MPLPEPYITGTLLLVTHRRQAFEATPLGVFSTIGDALVQIKHVHPNCPIELRDENQTIVVERDPGFYYAYKVTPIHLNPRPPAN